MRSLRKNGGFTLVELMVTVLAGTLVTMAAATVLLLGARINRQSMDTVQRQNTTRILMTMVEKMASEGAICRIESSPDGWTIYADTDGNAETDPVAVLSYASEHQAVQAAGEALLEGVYASHVVLDEKALMTFSIQTEDGNFVSSVYCRTAADVENDPGDEKDEPEEVLPPPEEEPDTGTEDAARLAFLQKLAGQFRLAGGGPNQGLILDDAGRSTGEYYTEWYIGQDGWNKNGWYATTPWCACFLSWGLENAGATMPDGSVPRFANVDKFMEAFGQLSDTPKPGDIVFFDWIVNQERNPQHVGAVLAVRDGFVYTIEGNSAGVVAMRRYELGDSRILGYGVLNWQ